MNGCAETHTFLFRNEEPASAEPTLFQATLKPTSPGDILVAILQVLPAAGPLLTAAYVFVTW